MIAAAPSARPLARSLTIAALATALDATLLALALGGFPGLLAHPRALALLAVWAAGNLVITLVRPRLAAAEQTDRDPLPVLFALFTLPFAAAPLSAWGSRAGVLPLAFPEAAHWLAIAFAAAGLALRAAAMARLGARFSPQVALQSGHQLETGGVYSRVRHPGYLGALIASLGAALAFGSALGLIPIALMIPALAARVAREDRMLEARFGDSFRTWRARTGGLLPRLGPRQPG